MAKQPDLFPDDDPYSAFDTDDSPLPEGYPKYTFQPLHPMFTRSGNVSTGGSNPRRYFVNLAIGECNCQKGYAFGYDAERKRSPWYNASYCTHKLRIMSSIVDNADDENRESLERAYMAALSTRYNPFDTVSAFHKELRRGDFEQAWFWGLVLSTKRSMAGVFKYLINILYEETRDHELGAWLLKTSSNPRAITLSNMCKAISWFCATPKKWEMPHRYAIFEAEMLGYEALVKDYGADVAKGANIIPNDQKDRLLKFMRAGLMEDNLVKFQRGLKGLQKLALDENGPKNVNQEALQEHRYWIYDTLYDIADKRWPSTHDGWDIVQIINDRIAQRHGIGYHELNAFADALAGEPITAGLLTGPARKPALARPKPPLPLGKWPQPPLYAHDNHTYAGKALMRRFPNQLKPGVIQKDLDFRWCGAYFGVCYRMVSYKQHGEVADWHTVKWPSKLHSIVTSLWY